MKRFLAFTLVAFAAFLLGHDFKVGIIPPLPTVVEAAQPSPETWSPDPPASQSEVPLLEFPVITGGIHDSVALYKALHEYPDLYKGFDFVTARLVQLDHALVARTSYRRDGKIRWTKSAVIIAAGTWVWFDGQNYIEAKCGNALDTTPAPLDPGPPVPSEGLAAGIPNLPVDVVSLQESPTVVPDAAAPLIAPPAAGAVPSDAAIWLGPPPIALTGSYSVSRASEPNQLILVTTGIFVLFAASSVGRLRRWRYRRTVARRLRSHIIHRQFPSRRAA